jgi:acyl carrier protein
VAADGGGRGPWRADGLGMQGFPGISSTARRRGRHRRERGMRSRIIEIIAKIREDPDLRERIDSRLHLMKDVGLTSLDMMQLFLEIEEEFDIEVDLDAVNLELFESIDRLTEFVAATVAAKSERQPTA